MVALKIWKTHPDITLPKHQTSQSACFDISYQSAGKNRCHGYTHLNKKFERLMQTSITVSPGDRIMVPTGMILDIPEGHSVRIHARSGMSLKQGLVLANAEGVIDSDYVEELFVLVHNISGNPITINNGDRIAQGELVKNVEYAIEPTSLRPGMKTERVGGMGSTGITTQAQLITISTDVPVKRGRGRPRKNA